MAFSLTWLPQVLLDAGLKVAEQPGWRESRPRRCRADQRCNLPSHGWRESREYAEPGDCHQWKAGSTGPAGATLPWTRRHIFCRCGRRSRSTTPEPAIGKASQPAIRILSASKLRIRVSFPDPKPILGRLCKMDAYRRGVAAILKKIRANAIMCCGHKEYALPMGRKPDPTFDMSDFRSQVSLIMAGIAPAPSRIPATDFANRPTLRRGDTGNLVETIQAKVGVPVNGTFDADTEAAVRQFQARVLDWSRMASLAPRTWASIAP